MTTILIVDDRPANREFLVTLLSYSGHRLLEAADGAEGLALARAERPDLVIADILMPTMDGYEFVHRLRSEPEIAGTPVIFYTAHYHEPEARRLAADCGVIDVLTKPCEPEIVLRTVETALGHLTTPPTVPSTPADQFDRDHLHLVTEKLSQKADELRRTNERLSAMIELGLQLGWERDPGRLLQVFCDSAREIVGARYAVLGVRNGEAPYRFFLTSGLDLATAARIDRSVPLDGVLGSVLANGRCFRTANNGLSSTGLPGSFPTARALLAVPLLSPGRVHGWVCLLDKVGADAFSEEDEQLAKMLGAQVGRIYENGSLYADLLRHSTKLADEVAERKRAEAELQKSSALLRAVAAGTNDAVYVKDRDGKYLLFNEAAAGFVGRPIHEVLGRDDSGLFEPDSVRIIKDRDHRVMSSGMIQTEEETLTAAGVTRTYLATKGPYRDETGAIIGVLGISRDITDRKRAEAELQAAQKRLQHVLTSSPAILFTLDLEGEKTRGISWISENLQSVFGYSTAEALDSAWWQKNIHPEDRDWVLAQIRDDLFRTGDLTQQYRFCHRDGGYRWTQGIIRLVRDGSQRPLEAVGSWLDITQQRQLEEQYRQAQKMEAVGQLAGGIAHDFNNLLTVINGFGELVLNNLHPSDPNHEAVAEIVNAGERAAGLTRQLLAFSRKAMIEPKVLDLGEIVRDVERILRRVVGEDVLLEVSAPTGLDRVLADPGQIEQVILNLVVNARDAMPRGGRLKITLQPAFLDENYARSHPDARPGHYLMLSVSDTGSGMDEAIQKRIFEPFFSTKGDRGTGLGLATVHGIVKQAGGHLSVETQVGQGSTFQVYLPRVDRERATPRLRTPAPALPLGGETILLVEDENAVRQFTRKVLENCGYTVLEARDAVEAVRLANEHRGRLDLLVTDVIMPLMSGRELAERMVKTHPGMKVLFLSGYTNDAIVQHGIQEAETSFLQKPFTPAVLAAKVRSALDGTAETGPNR